MTYLKFKKLDKKYESIIEGDKIFIINLKPNHVQIRNYWFTKC
jgi:hypothetical protein